MIHDIEIGDIVYFVGNNEKRIVLYHEGGGMVIVLTIDKGFTTKIQHFVRESHFYHKIPLDLL